MKMAVNSEFSGEAGGKSAPQNQTNNAVPKQPGNIWTFNPQTTFGAPIARQMGSENLNSVKKGLEDAFAQANPLFEIKLIALDRENISNLAYSAIVVCLRLKSKPELGVAYHILIIEATGEPLSPIIETINNQQVEILRCTGDALDGELLRIAEAAVVSEYPGVKVGNVDGAVVPRQFNSSDKYAIHLLALNAGLACGTEVEIRNSGFTDINIATAAGKDNNLEVAINFVRQNLTNACGRPMRSAAMVQFISKMTNRNQTQRYVSPNAAGRENVLTTVSLYPDVVWVRPRGMQTFTAPYMAQNVPQQCYAARMVITNISATNSFTPGNMLFALWTTLGLREDNNWVQMFRPTPQMGDKFDPYDIGALNAEANLTREAGIYGPRVDTKKSTFKAQELGEYISALFMPSIILSLDVPECDAQTWFGSMFSYASMANNPQPAYARIYDAAMTLTNGNFAKYFPVGTPMFLDTNNRVHLGHWTDSAGEVRDLRDIDYLYIANAFCEKNPPFIRDWSDTWIQDCGPLMQRLARRKAIIDGVSGGTAVFTGFAQRITFNGVFIDAIGKGVREAGIVAHVTTPLATGDMQNQRGVANFANSAFIPGGNNFFASAAPFGAGGYNAQYFNNNVGRFQ